jgi:CRP-like cAMP-binding protein
MRAALAAPHSPNQNHLLAALPTADFEALSAHLTLVPLALGDMLYEPGRPMAYAYFPTTAVVSLYFVTESGASAETAGVGREGVVGTSIFLGDGRTASSAMVQIAGHAYRLERRDFKAAFDEAGVLARILLRYTLALMTQVAQTAACNRHHAIQQQLSRWLLLNLARASSDELVMTQELAAHMLGVRRESVTEAAGALQQQGYIRYRRGHITVLDKGGLETQACECYAVVKKELSRLLPDVLLRQAAVPAPAPAPALAH